MTRTALVLSSLLAGSALAQTPVPAPEAPPSKAFQKAIPQLYFLKLQGLLQDAVIDPLAHRYAVKSTLRLKLDASGAIVKWNWVTGVADKPIYARAIEKLMRDFGPEGSQRLPIADDPQLAEQVIQHGFLCTLKFKPQPAFEKARRAAKRTPAEKAPTPAVTPASKK